MSTTWEQLEGAVLTLARSGAIKDRLGDAFRNHLAQLSVDDLPEALRVEFQTCHDTLTHAQPLRGEDAVRATVRKMSNDEADAVACRVVRLFGALALASQHLQVRPEMAAVVAHEPPAVVNAVNGHSDVPNGNSVLSDTLVLNAVLKGKRKNPKRVPQIISLYAAEA
jgi:hypothetical protein